MEKRATFDRDFAFFAALKGTAFLATVFFVRSRVYETTIHQVIKKYIYSKRKSVIMGSKIVKCESKPTNKTRIIAPC